MFAGTRFIHTGHRRRQQRGKTRCIRDHRRATAEISPDLPKNWSEPDNFFERNYFSGPQALVEQIFDGSGSIFALVWLKARSRLPSWRVYSWEPIFARACISPELPKLETTRLTRGLTNHKTVCICNKLCSCILTRKSPLGTRPLCRHRTVSMVTVFIQQ